jgi:acetolactate synthase small subunit
MSLRTINITIPASELVPDIISTFTPEENMLMLKIGSNCLKEGRQAVAGLTQKELYNKIKDETKDEIKKLETNLLVEKELKSRISEEMTKMYQKQLEQMNKQIDTFKSQIKIYESENSEFVRTEVEKERDKYRIILDEKDKQLNRMTENYERFLKQNEVKSSKKIGDEGEENFILLSETFKDFPGYKLEKKAHQAHKGDIHLFFKDFNVLVDLKNYSGSVQKKELDKIEHDLSINNTMDFAWLISYDSNVSDWNRFPIMYKWIVTEIGLKCVVIVNNLNANKSPVDVLRNVWSITNELQKMMSKTKVEEKDVQDMMERDYNVVQKIKMAQKRLSELRRTVLSMSQITKDIENDILDALSLLSNEIVKNESEKNVKIKEWWDLNIEIDDNDENKLTSTEIWTRFKKDNKEYVDENKLLIDDFKNYVKIFIDVDKYNEKSKKGSIEFIGFKFKEEHLLVTQPIEIEINIPNVIQKKKKVINKTINKQSKFVIDEEVDNSIVDQYITTDDDIIIISKAKNVMVWQIVSVLVNNKIINKRNDARGYEKYKETDEYKSKINDSK